MSKSKFENEKFILDFSYNEKLEKFEKIKYTEKNLNELENKILKEVCLLIPKCNLQELYEHLIIRVENKLRDFKKTNYSGIIFAENLSDEYRYFKKFFREFFKPYIKKNLNKSINFQTIKPSAEWINLKSNQKVDRIYDILRKYDKSDYKLVEKLKINKIKNNVDIYIELPANTDINSKNKLCLDIEIFLKKNLEESLNVYLESAIDENKLRRLSL